MNKNDVDREHHSVLTSEQNHDQITLIEKTNEAKQINIQKKSDKEIIQSKRNNLEEKVSLDSDKPLTPKIFMANIKYKITRKFSDIIANVPRSIVYSNTYENLKTIIQTKLSSSSSSNNIDKLKINEGNLMDFSIESDHSVHEAKNIKKYKFNDEMLVKKLNLVNTEIPQYCLKSNIKMVTSSNTAQLRDQSVNIDVCDHELILIKNMNASDLQGLVGLDNNHSVLTNKTAIPFNQASRPVNQCKNYEICKGKGNTNKYTNCKTHRKVQFCPIESKNSVKNKTKQLNDANRNLYDQLDDSASLSDELIEVQSKGCQSSFQDNNVILNTIQSDLLDHNMIPNVANNADIINDQNAGLINDENADIINDQNAGLINDENADIINSNFSSFNLSLNHQVHNNLANTSICAKTNLTTKNISNYQNIPNHKMVIEIEKTADVQVASYLPIIIDQSSNLFTGIAVSESNDENSTISIISNQTDDSHIKSIYEKTGIRRTKSINFTRRNFNLIKNKKTSFHEETLESHLNLYQELQNSYVKLQIENQEAELEISKLNGLIDQKNKKCCPTKGCYGQGNVNNENFEGHHNVLSSCPLAFIQNQNNDQINMLRLELLKVKTELNVEKPRLIDQIDYLNKTNKELKLKLEQMNSIFYNKKVQLHDVSTEINKELFEENEDTLKTELELINIKNSCKKIQDENNNLKNQLHQLEKKYQAMISHNSSVITNLENDNKRVEIEMNLKLDAKIFEQNILTEKNNNLIITNKILNEKNLKLKDNIAEINIEKEKTINNFKIKIDESNAQHEKLNDKLNEINDDLNRQFTNSMAKEICLNDQIKSLKIIINNLESQLIEKNSVIEKIKETSSKEIIQYKNNIKNHSGELKNSNEKTSKYEKELLEARQEIDGLKEIFTSSKNQLDQSNNNINDLKNQLNDSYNKEKNLNEKLQLATLSIENLKGQLTDFMQKETCLNDQIKNLNKMIASLTSKLNGKKIAWNTTQEIESKENIKLKIKISEINAKLITSDSKIKYLENELKTQQLLTNKLKEELDEFKKHEISLEEELTNSKAKEKCLYDQINDLKSTINILESEIKEKKSVIESQKETLSKECVFLDIKIESLSDQLKKSNDKAGKLEKELQEANLEINSFKSKLNESNSTVEALNKKLIESSEMVTGLKNQYDHSNKMINELTIDLNVSKEKERSLNDELKVSKLSVDNLNRQLNVYMDKETCLNVEVYDLKSMIKSLEGQLKGEISIIESNKETLSKEIIQLNTKITGLSIELNNSKDKTLKLETKFRVATEEIKCLKTKLKESNGSVDSLNKDLKDSKDFVTNLNNLLHESNKNVNDLTYQLNDSRSKEKSLNDQLTEAKQSLENLNRKLFLSTDKETESEKIKLLTNQQKESTEKLIIENKNLSEKINCLNRDQFQKINEINELNNKVLELQDENKRIIECEKQNLNKFLSVNNTHINLQNQTSGLNANIEKLKNESAKTIKALEDDNYQLKIQCNLLLHYKNNQKSVDQNEISKLKEEIECLKNEKINLDLDYNNVNRTICILKQENINLQAKILSSAEPNNSLLDALNRLKNAEIKNNDLNNQNNELINIKNLYQAEGIKLFNEHNQLKLRVEIMINENTALVNERNNLIYQLNDEKKNHFLFTRQCNTEIERLKTEIIILKRHDQSDNERCYESEENSNENSINYYGPINKYPDNNFNNNLGQCPYCPRKGFKNVNIHIGHAHKCKNCRKLTFECKCNKRDIIETIRIYQSQQAVI